MNRFPDFVRYAVQQVMLFCPTLGKVKIADMLARAGIHIGKTTVGRILNGNPVKPPDSTTDDAPKQCKIVSKYPGHTWNADLTAVPISGGFWTNWIPNAICHRCERVLVGLERDRSFFTALYGSRGVPVPAHVRRSDCGL